MPNSHEMRPSNCGKFNGINEDPIKPDKTLRERTSLIWSILHNSRSIIQECLGRYGWLSKWGWDIMPPCKFHKDLIKTVWLWEQTHLWTLPASSVPIIRLLIKRAYKCIWKLLLDLNTLIQLEKIYMYKALALNRRTTTTHTLNTAHIGQYKKYSTSPLFK